MKTYFYFQVFRRTLIQFLDCFNNIKIARYSNASATEADRYITVPIKHSIKEKVYYWLDERKDDEMLPMITAYISSIDYAVDRKVNSFHAFTANCDSITGENPSVSTFLHPVPYNMSFMMNIWALHMTDVDQILEQILPFFSPHIYTRIHLNRPNIDFDVKIIFRSATPEVSHEMADMEYRVINYTLDFECQSWMFKPLSDVGLIKKIYGSYSTDPLSFRKQVNDTTSTFSSGASGYSTESFRISGGIDNDGNEITRYDLFSVG